MTIDMQGPGTSGFGYGGQGGSSSKNDQISQAQAQPERSAAADPNARRQLERVGDIVSAAMDRIEASVQNALQRYNTVQNVLDDLGHRARESDQRQRDFMDDIRRQVREIADAQLAALQDFDTKLDNKLAELRRASGQDNRDSKP